MSKEDKLDKIKKFFTKKKEQAKFKMNIAGPGRKLNAEAPIPSKSKPEKEAYVPPKREDLTNEAKRAAIAAMSRFQGTSSDFDFSLQAIRAQAKKELEAERLAKEAASQEQIVEEPKEEYDPSYAVQGVFYRCPLVSDEILPKKEWKGKIKEFLYEQLEHERGLTSCLIIYNCNVKDRIEPCVETLIRYLENIISHPDEEKYRKIRMTNRIFQDKVKDIEGSMDFLQAAGFKETTIDDEQFLIFDEDVHDTAELLNSMIEALRSSEPLHLELDRNIQVLLPSQVKNKALPPEFFRLSTDEIKREQQMRAEALERAQVLMTKAMREKEEQRIINRYNYALIRIRFPDGVYLQGTFHVYETLDGIFELVRSALKDQKAEFSLVSPTGHKFTDAEKETSLHDLKLVPNTVLNFAYENESKRLSDYLKEEMMLLIQQI